MWGPREPVFTLCVMRGQRDHHDASSRGGQRVVSLSRQTEPGGGGAGTTRLSHGAGDEDAVRRVLQTQLPHISEDGLPVELRHQLLWTGEVTGWIASHDITTRYLHRKGLSLCVCVRGLTLRYMREGWGSTSLWTL